MDTVQIEISIEDSCTEPKVIALTASMTEEVSRPEKAAEAAEWRRI